MEAIFVKLEKINQHFRATSNQPENERFLQRIVKLNEEVGELCEAALCEVDQNQRKKDKEINFDAELADVIICALMLSTSRKADIAEEIHKKLDKVISRLNIGG
jgi:NTP pyrophosphatase (non-canonical NTP hydrolase)